MTRQQRRAQARQRVKRERPSHQAMVDEIRLRALSQALKSALELDQLLEKDSVLVAYPILRQQVRARIQAAAPHLRDM